MSITVTYKNPEGLTSKQYDEVMERLEKAGAIPSAPGLLYHVCFGEEGKMQILDVWESQSDFDKFSETLLPIIDAVGIAQAEPEITEVHDILN